MNRDQLHALQAPLKQRYRDEPAAALVCLKAEGRLGEGVILALVMLAVHALAFFGAPPKSPGAAAGMALTAYFALAGAAAWLERRGARDRAIARLGR